MITITVTWMDGKQEAYSAYDYRVTDAQQLVIQPQPSGMRDSYCIPLSNVRVWKIER